jgi:hypothetical protein
MDQGQLDALYQQYLGRGVDPSGAASWGGADYNTVVNGILGSQEYQNRQQPQPQAQGMADVLSPSGGGDINSIYQQYLGRGVDPSGAATYAGWDPQSIINAVTSSQEYRNRSGGGAAQPAVATGNPQDLANQVFSLYRTNQNYDQQLNQLNALPQNADYYKARIGLLGQQMGWQTGQNTGDRNSVYQQQLQSYLPGARAAGLSDAEINNLINQNAAQQSAVNQERIASDAKAPQGWVNQNIPGGYMTLAAAAALAAPYLAPELFGSLGAAEGVAGGTATGTGLTSGGVGASNGILGGLGTQLSGAAATQSGLGLGALEGLYGTSIGLEGTAGAGSLAGILGSQSAAGLGGALAGIGLSLTPEQLAAYEAGALPASSLVASGLSASQLANLAKTGLTATSLATKLFGSSGTKPTTTGTTGTPGINPNALANALKNVGSSGQAQTGSGFNLVRGNVNPFTYGKDVPTQTLAANKTDPFAALNVAQTPITPYNPLAHLVG